LLSAFPGFSARDLNVFMAEGPPPRWHEARAEARVLIFTVLVCWFASVAAKSFVRNCVKPSPRPQFDVKVQTANLPTCTVVEKVLMPLKLTDSLLSQVR
jgi:hypothetical protein